MKFNDLGIFQSLKLRNLMEKILRISLSLNFSLNTLCCYGLTENDRHDVAAETECDACVQVQSGRDAADGRRRGWRGRGLVHPRAADAAHVVPGPGSLAPAGAPPLSPPTAQHARRRRQPQRPSHRRRNPPLSRDPATRTRSAPTPAPRCPS